MQPVNWAPPNNIVFPGCGRACGREIADSLSQKTWSRCHDMLNHWVRVLRREDLHVARKRRSTRPAILICFSVSISWSVLVYFIHSILVSYLWHHGQEYILLERRAQHWWPRLWIREANAVDSDKLPFNASITFGSRGSDKSWQVLIVLPLKTLFLPARRTTALVEQPNHHTSLLEMYSNSLRPGGNAYWTARARYSTAVRRLEAFRSGAQRTEVHFWCEWDRIPRPPCLS